MPSNRVASAIANYTILTVSIIFSLLLIDFLYEKLFYKDEEEISAYASWVAYKPFPYVMFKGSPGVETGFATETETVYYNSLGYRGAVPSLEKPKDEFRVIVIGGSTVLGGSVDVVTLLERKFHQEGYKKVRCYNFGASSSGSGQGLARIVFEAWDYKPDLIIMYNGANDLEHPFFRDPRPGYPFNFLVTEANPIYAKSISEVRALPLLLYKSAILRTFFRDQFTEYFTNREEIMKTVGYRSQDWFERIIDTYWTFMKKSSLASNTVGADFLAVFQPLIYYKDHLAGIELVNKNEHADKDFNKLRDMLRAKHAKDKSFPFFDKSDLFDDTSEEVFLDTCHIHDEHQVKVADMLFDLTLRNTKFAQTKQKYR